MIILTSLGSIIAFLTVVTIIVRAIFRIVNATEDNTEAVKNSTKSINEILTRLNRHESRLAVLEDRIHRNGHP